MQISQLGKYNAIIIDKRENTARNDKVFNSNFERFVRVTVFLSVFLVNCIGILNWHYWR